MELYELSACELHNLIKGKEVSVEEVVTSLLQRIKKVEERIKAFLSFYEKEALNEARKWDKKISRGEEVGPLAGIPIAIKDNLCLDSAETSCASNILKGFYPPYSATVLNKLNKAGTILLGKTNMDEFAMGSSTENSAFQITRNPWNLETAPGGSS